MFSGPVRAQVRDGHTKIHRDGKVLIHFVEYLWVDGKKIGHLCHRQNTPEQRNSECNPPDPKTSRYDTNVGGILQSAQYRGA